MVQPLWRTIWRFLKKLKTELPYNLAAPLSGTYPEKTVICRVNILPSVLCCTIYNSQDMEAA